MICVNMNVSPVDVQKFGCSVDTLRQRCVAAYKEFVNSEYYTLITYEINRKKALYRLFDEENAELALIIAEKN